MGAKRKKKRSRKKLGTVFFGLVLAGVGFFGASAAQEYLATHPEIMLGAAVNTVFLFDHNLTPMEMAIVAASRYGTLLGLAGIGIVVLGLARKR